MGRLGTNILESSAYNMCDIHYSFKEFISIIKFYNYYYYY